MKKRIIAFALVLALLFASTSCRRGADDEIPPKNDDLTVETVPVEYSEAEVSEASDRICAITIEAARIFDCSDYVTDAEIDRIKHIFSEDVVHILVDVLIYPEELDGILECVEEILPALESGNDGLLKTLSDMYSKLLRIIDADRIGELSYEIQLLALQYKRERAVEKYKTYGYSFYLEDAERYATLEEQAREIGRKSFSDAVSALLFAPSLINGSLEFENEGGVSLSVGDAFAIMKKQSEKFAALNLSDEDWQTIAAISEEFLPNVASDNLESRLLLSLGEGDFFIEAAKIMPELFLVCEKLTSDISSDSIALVENGEAYAYARVLCAQILKHEKSFRELLASLEENIPAPTDKNVEAINKYDREGYTEFCESYISDIDGLIDAVRGFSISPTEENYTALLDAYLGYISSINSALAFAYFYN